MQKSHCIGLGLVALTAAATLSTSGLIASAIAAPAASGAAPAMSHGAPGHDHAGGHTHTTRLAFTTQPTSIKAGQQALWQLKIVDDIDGSPIKDFDKVHEKLMHLIVVSKDLTWFNHLHPVYKGNGLFEIRTTIPRAGAYKLYADYRPTEREGEVAQHEFSVSGPNALPARPTLKSDTSRNGWINRSVRSAPEGSPYAPQGATYQVGLMPMPAKLRAKQDAMLHFQVRDAKGKPVKLEPYLGALGHLVLLSSDSKTYLHTHPLEGSGDHAAMGHNMGDMKMDSSKASKNSTSEVMFHTNFPSPGQYKGWGQFKHAGKIITAAFVLNVGATATPAAPAKAVTSKAGVQRATVVIDGGYKPSTVRVTAGKPVELTFVRREKVGCGDTVVIPSLKQRFSLKTGQSRKISFTPKKNQTVAFTCGMSMYSGQVVAK
jgi:hypothetical protein